MGSTEEHLYVVLVSNILDIPRQMIFGLFNIMVVRSVKPMATVLQVTQHTITIQRLITAFVVKLFDDIVSSQMHFFFSSPQDVAYPQKK